MIYPTRGYNSSARWRLSKVSIDIDVPRNDTKQHEILVSVSCGFIIRYLTQTSKLAQTTGEIRLFAAPLGKLLRRSRSLRALLFAIQLLF